MKKLFYLVLSLILVLSLAGCGEKKNVEPIEEQEEIVDNQQEDVGNTYFSKDDLYIYNIFQIIRLDENPTTGYQWIYTVDDESVAVVEGDEYTVNESEEGMVGVGGVHTFRLSGLQAGVTKITFRNMRSWEGEASATEVVTFDIAVNENSEIAITGETHQ